MDLDWIYFIFDILFLIYWIFILDSWNPLVCGRQAASVSRTQEVFAPGRIAGVAQVRRMTPSNINLIHFSNIRTVSSLTFIRYEIDLIQ